MIKLNQLTKCFGSTTAIDHISLELQPGQIIGLVGPDGAGKTTLIRLMLGILTPSSGTVNILETDNLESIKKHIGYVAQKFSLYQDLTVIENLKLIGALYGQRNSIILEKAQTILNFTGLWDFKNRLSRHLSGGMKQKLSLAAGLMHTPKLLFLDEPTTGVDPVSRREFWQLLYQLNQEGMSILIATPYMDEAELCDKIAFLNHGKLICFESPDQLIASYPYEILELNTNHYINWEENTNAAIIDINSFGDKYHIVTTDSLKAKTFLEQSLHGSSPSSFIFKQIKPNLEDIFINLSDRVDTKK